jgi:hypothetical protein
VDSLGEAFNIAMPLASAPLDIEVKESATNRPCREIEVTQTFDERSIDEGRIRLRIDAEGYGLIPELTELVNLGEDISGYRIKGISGQGNQLVALEAGDQLSALCSRAWSVELEVDGRQRDLARTFTFPSAKDGRVKELTNMRYNYGKLEPCDGATIDVGWIPMGISRYITAGAGLLLLTVLLRVAYPYARRYFARRKPKLRYEMPDPITPFAVSALVRQIDADARVRLDEQQRQQLRQDAAAIDALYFREGEQGGKDLDLKSIAAKWLRTGEAMAGKR